MVTFRRQWHSYCRILQDGIKILRNWRVISDFKIYFQCERFAFQQLFIKSDCSNGVKRGILAEPLSTKWVFTWNAKPTYKNQRIHKNHIKHCKLEFGKHVQIHEQHDNSLTPRTSEAILLSPTRNEQSSPPYILSLHSEKNINRKRWNIMPMPSEVIDQVKQMALRLKRYLGITFTEKT